MAHTKHSPTGLLLPVVFSAILEPMTEVVCIGDWVVGYSEDSSLRFLDFGAEPPADLLLENVETFRRHAASPEEVRRFLLRDGSFRNSDWTEVATALTQTLPVEVKDEIRRASPRGLGQVYLIRANDFTSEWRLLDSLMRLATKLGNARSVIKALPEIDEAQKILADLRGLKAIPIREGSSFLSTLDFVLPGDPVADEEADKQYEEWYSRWEASQSLPKKTGKRLENLLEECFRRVLGKLDVHFKTNLKHGPGFWVNVDSHLSVAYLALLANFRRGWRNCKREDCGNLFRVTDDARKVFCSQYCGHLVSLRAKRKAAQQRKTSGKRNQKRGNR